MRTRINLAILSIVSGLSLTSISGIDVKAQEYISAELCEYDEIDKAMMAMIVHAEAENQDIIGKRLVVDCILNRIDSESFPNSVVKVLTGKQFSMADHYTDVDMQAVEKELEERLDTEIVYFRTKHYHTYGTPAYQHGDHYFSNE